MKIVHRHGKKLTHILSGQRIEINKNNNSKGGGETTAAAKQIAAILIWLHMQLNRSDYFMRFFLVIIVCITLRNH